MKKKALGAKSTKITVLLLDHHLASEKTLQIPKKLVQYWRHYLLVVVGLFVALIAAIIFFVSQNHILNRDSMRLQSKLEKVKEYPKKMKVVQTKMQKLETTMAKVTAYLKKRGIKQEEAAGGKGGVPLALDEHMEDVLDQYIFYADTLHHNLANLPIGYPIYGQITSHYGLRSNPFSESAFEVHPGVDIQAKRGAAVKAPAHGRVVFANWRGGYGRCIMIRHDKGFETLYGHLSAILVKPGEEVRAGEVIGKVGSTGRSTGPHLHYEITQNGKRINPSLFLKNN